MTFLSSQVTITSIRPSASQSPRVYSDVMHATKFTLNVSPSQPPFGGLGKAMTTRLVNIAIYYTYKLLNKYTSETEDKPENFDSSPNPTKVVNNK